MFLNRPNRNGIIHLDGLHMINFWEALFYVFIMWLAARVDGKRFYVCLFAHMETKNASWARHVHPSSACPYIHSHSLQSLNRFQPNLEEWFFRTRRPGILISSHDTPHLFPDYKYECFCRSSTKRFGSELSLVIFCLLAPLFRVLLKDASYTPSQNFC